MWTSSMNLGVPGGAAAAPAARCVIINAQTATHFDIDWRIRILRARLDIERTAVFALSRLAERAKKISWVTPQGSKLLP